MMKYLETERLIIRDWCMDDIDAFYSMLSKKEIVQYLGGQTIDSKEQAADAIKRYSETGSAKAICLKNNEVIGLVSFYNVQLDPEISIDNQYEFGFSLDIPYWGNGYATEMCNAFTNYLAKEKNARTIWLRHFDFNTRSKRVIQKCQFKYQYKVERTLKYWDNRKTQHLHYRKDFTQNKIKMKII